MNTNTNTPLTGPVSEARVCSHTGLSKPECHCTACLRDLVARFRPDRRG